MNTTKLVITAAFALVVSACGASGSEPSSSTPAAVAPATTSVGSVPTGSRDAGFEILDECLGAITEAAADVDLENPEVDALLADVFVDGLPTECDLLETTSPEDFGLTQAEVAARREAVLPARLLEFLLGPVE